MLIGKLLKGVMGCQTLGSIDLHKYRGDTFDETQFTVCEEAYNGLSDFLDKEGNFNVEGYITFCNSEASKQ